MQCNDHAELSIFKLLVRKVTARLKNGLFPQRTYRSTLPPSCAFVVKSGKLNFLEPSGSLQACNGTALPFFLQQCRCN